MRAAALGIPFLVASAFGAGADTAMTFRFQDIEQPFALDDPQSRAGFTRFMSVDAVSFEGVAGAARLVVQLSLPPDGASRMMRASCSCLTGGAPIGSRRWSFPKAVWWSRRCA